MIGPEAKHIFDALPEKNVSFLKTDSTGVDYSFPKKIRNENNSILVGFLELIIAVKESLKRHLVISPLPRTLCERYF